METTSSTTTTDVLSNFTNASSSLPRDTNTYKSYLKDVEWICQGVLMPLLGVLGLAGNALILVVLTRKNMASASKYFLAAIAVSDTCYLVLQVPFQLLVHGTASAHSYSPVGGYYWIIWYVASHLFFNATCWLTTAVVLERYLSLRFSFLSPMKRIKIIVASIFVASVILNVSKCFEFVPSLDIELLKPATGTALLLTKNYTTVRSILNCMLVVIVPFLLMVVLGCLLLRRRMSVQETAGDLSGDDIGSRNVVFYVVVLFVVCFLLEVYNSFNLAVNGSGIYGQTSNVVLVYVGRVLGAVNASGKFPIYTAASKHFRSDLYDVFAEIQACFRRITGSASGSTPIDSALSVDRTRSEVNSGMPGETYREAEVPLMIVNH